MDKIKCKICGHKIDINPRRTYETKAGKKIDCLRCCSEHEVKE